MKHSAYVIDTFLLLIFASYNVMANADSTILPANINKEYCQASNDTIRHLKEVVVKSNRIHMKENGYTISLKGTGLEKTNSAIDMLAMLPNLFTQDGVIYLMDKLPIIYIDGIMITNQNELAALMPNDISKVEVEYQSIGEGLSDRRGVIRITRSKKLSTGTSGYLKESTKEMPSYGHTNDNFLFGIDVTTKRLTLSYWINYNHQKLLEDADNSYKFKNDNIIESYQKDRSWSNNFSNRLNLGGEIGRRSTLAISDYFSADYTKNKRNSTSYSDGGFHEYYEYYHAPERNLTNQVVGKYNVKTDSIGSNLDITVDYLYQRYTLNQYQESDATVLLNGRDKELTNMFRINTTWNKNYINGSKLRIGANYQFISNHTFSESSLDYIADVPSTFISYRGMYKKVAYAFGLTTQYSRVKVKDDGVSTVKNRFYICPQVNFMWNLNQSRGMSVQMMYQQGIGTMPYSVISASRHYTTSNHYDTGNPDLQTPYNNQLNILFNMNRHFSLMFMGNYESHPIYYSHGIDATNPKETWSRPENGKYRLGTGLGAEYNGKPAKWLIMKVRMQASQIKFSSKEYYSKGTVCGKFWWNNILNFTNTFGGSMNTYWETGSKFETYSWRPVGSINVGLWKTLINNKLRLSLTSMLLGRQRKTELRTDDYVSTYKNKTKITSFTLSITWYFSKGRKVEKQIDAESIQNYEKIVEKK